MPEGAPALPFEQSTRNKIVPFTALVKPVGGGLTPVELPKTGYLARIWLSISVTFAGTVTTVNPLGVCSCIRRVKLTTNSAVDIYNVSGPGNFYILQNMVEMEGINGRQPKNQGSSAPVTATTFNLDMVIPVQINLKDTLGLLLLQNEQLQVTLSVEWEADANVVLTGGGTYTGTATPWLEFFTVPPDPRSRPPINYLHSIIEDQVGIPSAADYPYPIPRGNIYLQVGLGYGINTAAADNWNRLILRINQSDILYDLRPQTLDMLVGYRQNLTRTLGYIPLDWLASDGFGSYGSARDFINSGVLTDLLAILTPTGAGTMYVVRRMLVPLAPQLAA